MNHHGDSPLFVSMPLSGDLSNSGDYGDGERISFRSLIIWAKHDRPGDLNHPLGLACYLHRGIGSIFVREAVTGSRQRLPDHSRLDPER